MPEYDERALFLRISRTVHTTPYQQSKLLDEASFESFLRDRDIRFGSAIALLRHSGYIAPVLVQRNITSTEKRSDRFIKVSGTKDDPVYAELPRVRTVRRKNQRWIRLRDRRAQYHPFQIWLVLRLEEHIRSGIPIMSPLLSKEGYIRAANRHVDEVWGRMRGYRRSNEYLSFLRLLSLLVAIDPLVIPGIRSRVSVSVPFETLEDYRVWVRQQRGRSVLRRSGLKLAELKEWHQKIASHVSLMDPNERWFDLIRNASFDARMRLKGQALLAQTLYEMAEMIRRFAEGWLGVDWEEENDVRHGPFGQVVKRNLYGGARIADGDPKVTMNVLRDFGLDPQPRMHLFVEGPTEIGFLNRYAEEGLGINLRRAGIELVDFEGYQKVTQQRQYLERLQAEQRFPYIVIDYEESGIRQLKIYANEGLLPAGFKYWRRDFEEDNFSISELISVAATLARQAGVKVGATIAEVKRRRRAASEKGLKKQKDVVNYINECFGPRFNFSKGLRWGEALADWALDHDCPKTHTDKNGQRPIIGVLQFALRAAFADYLGSVEDMASTETGEVVKRSTMGGDISD